MHPLFRSRAGRLDSRLSPSMAGGDGYLGTCPCAPDGPCPMSTRPANLISLVPLDRSFPGPSVHPHHFSRPLPCLSSEPPRQFNSMHRGIPSPASSLAPTPRPVRVCRISSIPPTPPSLAASRTRQTSTRTSPSPSLSAPAQIKAPLSFIMPCPGLPGRPSIEARSCRQSDRTTPRNET